MDLMLPPTSTKHYLTGKTALNIPSPEGTGDWHFVETFEGYAGRDPKHFLVAGVDTLDTRPVLGQLGIYDCRDQLVKRGLKVPPQPIYAADHYRAIMDMILNAIYRNWDFEGAIILDDWLPEQSERDRLFFLLTGIRFALEHDQWKKIEAWASRQIH